MSVSTRRRYLYVRDLRADTRSIVQRVIVMRDVLAGAFSLSAAYHSLQSGETISLTERDRKELKMQGLVFARHTKNK